MKSAGDETNSRQDEGACYTPSQFTGEKTRKRKLSTSAVEADSSTLHNAELLESDSTPLKDRFLDSKRCCRKLFTSTIDDFVSPMLALPDELLSQLILYLKPKEIGRLSCTCRRFCSIISENYLWRGLCRGHFLTWNDRLYEENQDTAQQSTSTFVNPYVGKCWKRQYILNSTKGIFYQNLGGSSRGRTINKIAETPTAYGYRKMCCSRDHIFALDFAGILHVYRWERDPVTNEFSYKKASWHREFSKHVVDVSTDPRYDNAHRRYVYVLSQSSCMQNKRLHPNTRRSNAENVTTDGLNEYGIPCCGDKIDVFDERSCRRVFNMTFDPEMRFTSMKLTSAEAQQKTLFMLTDAGKVYSLHLFEPSLLNLGTEGIQVTLKSASKCLGEKVKAINTSVGIVSFITVSGKVHIIAQRPGEFYDLFGRENTARLGVPLPVSHIAKVVHCSIGDRHMGFIDEYGRAFVMGNNRYGQLGTGDRMDRTMPTQVLCNKNVRNLHCSLNHTLAVVESWERCSVYGAGCGNNGRLPGRGRGSVEFLKLDIKIPWSTRQIDTHKESFFALSCHDIEEKTLFKKRANRDDFANDNLMSTPKSLQELFMDMKKTFILGEKVKIMEAMIEILTKNVAKPSHLDLSQFKTIAQSSVVAPKKVSPKPQGVITIQEMNLLRNAAEILRHEVERVQLDVEILRNNQSS